MKPAQALAYFRQLSCLGLDSRLVVPAMMRALHDVVPSSHNFFFWTDACGAPVNIFAEEVIPAVFGAYAEAGPEAEAASEPHVRRLATLPQGVGLAAELFCPVLFDRSWTREAILAPYRMDGSSLFASVRARGGEVLGVITMGRAPGERAFSDAECATLSDLRTYVRHALQAPPAATGPEEAAAWVDSEDTGMVLAGPDGRILHMSARAVRMVASICDPEFIPGVRLTGCGPMLPEPLLALCRNLAAIRAGAAAPPPSTELVGPWGRLRCRAHFMDAVEAGGEAGGEGAVVISITQRQPLALHLAQRLQALSLTGRQRDVALMLGLGRSPEETVLALGIRRSTYRDHVADIYDRLGVGSRTAFLGRVLNG